MEDKTENSRRALLNFINAEPRTYEEVVAEFGEGDVFTITTLSENFEVLSFLAPYVYVRRKSDRREGTLMFQHLPRIYFGFEEA